MLHKCEVALQAVRCYNVEVHRAVKKLNKYRIKYMED